MGPQAISFKQEEIKISCAIMAHPSRKEQADKLYNRLCKQGFHSVSLVYDKTDNEWDTGSTALQSHTDSDWHIVVQDDAIVDYRTFGDNVRSFLNHLPKTYNGDPRILSFYTGTVKPYLERVELAIQAAKATNASFIEHDTLYWGVGIAIPTDAIQSIVDTESNIPEYDARIGEWCKNNNVPVYYTYPSIVDHDYTLDSVLEHGTSEPRRAHYYEPKKVYPAGKHVFM